MATRNPTLTNEADGFRKLVFTGLTKTTDDVTAPISPGHAGVCVQVIGTFGSGGTVVWEGSNDGGTTWATLSDLQGTAISRTTAAIKTCQDFALLQRARVTAGDGDTALSVVVVMRPIPG